jgi:hypothetical protein
MFEIDLFSADIVLETSRYMAPVFSMATDKPGGMASLAQRSLIRTTNTIVLFSSSLITLQTSRSQAFI